MADADSVLAAGFGSGTVTVTTELDKVVVEYAQADLIKMLRLISAGAITEQVSLNNPPTNIIVDNSGRRPIDTATKRVQAFFTDKSQIRDAVFEAWDRIQKLTRVATGQASHSYQLWFKETPIGASPAAVDIYIDRMDPATDYFRIVGPVLVYGRKVYWNPAGKAKFQRRIIGRTPNVLIKSVRIKGIMKQVEETMKRRYRGIGIAESWVTTSALPKDGRTPALWIGFRKKGAVA